MGDMLNELQTERERRRGAKNVKRYHLGRMRAAQMCGDHESAAAERRAYVQERAKR
jgi:hypothetical protein